MEQKAATSPNPSPSLIYFLKEIVSNEVIIKGRKPAFENIGGNRGVIALDPSKDGDSDFIAGLTDFANRGVGGVVKISAETYAQKKSQPILNPSGRHSAELRIRRPAAPASKRQAQPPPEAEVTGASVARPADSLQAMGLGDETPPPPTPAAVAAAEPDEQAFRPPTRRISRKPKPAPEAAPAA